MKRPAVSGTLVLFPGSSRSSRPAVSAGPGGPAGRQEREPVYEVQLPDALGPDSRRTVAADPAERKARLDEQLAKHAALDRMLAEFVGQHDGDLTAGRHEMPEGSAASNRASHGLK